MCGTERRAAPGPPRGARGTTLAEALVGLLAGTLALLAALVLARGFVRLAGGLVAKADGSLGLEGALARMAAEVSAAEPGGGAPPDEPLELVAPWAIGLRRDRDGDQPARALDPERWLGPGGAVRPVANDEVVVYLRRNAGGGGRHRAVFEADLDSPDRVTLPDGTVLARRDGRVERIDAGPAAGEEDRSPGTLYRVTFVHDARRAGTGRFRVVEPLADGVVSFRVRAFDGAGREMEPCGGEDTAGARACRARVARLLLEVGVAGEGAPAERVRRVEVRPGGVGR